MTRAEVSRLITHIQRELMVLIDHAPDSLIKDQICVDLNRILSRLYGLYHGHHMTAEQVYDLNVAVQRASIMEIPQCPSDPQDPPPPAS